jgi:DNA polymerase III subunit epsilon
MTTLTDVTAEFPGEPGLLARCEFVIVDVETTGWHPEEASITEIGAVRVRAGQVLGEYSALVNPGGSIPADIAALTGITDAMVSHAPPVRAVLPCFLAFAEGCMLAAHNAPFDVGFLSAACGASGLPWPAFPVLDTVALARALLGQDEVPDCKLATLASFFGARTLPCHRALPDAKATADVLEGLLARLATDLAYPRPDQRLGYATAAAGGAGARGPRRRQWSPLSFLSRRTLRGSRRRARR